MAVTVTTLLPLHDAASLDHASGLVSAMMQAGTAVGGMPMTLGGRRYLAVLAEAGDGAAAVPHDRVAYAA